MAGNLEFQLDAGQVRFRYTSFKNEFIVNLTK